ncbi:hypothetical protein Tco_1183871 [Tanacetum coccineum]
MVFNSPCLIDKKELIHHEGTWFQFPVPVYTKVAFGVVFKMLLFNPLVISTKDLSRNLKLTMSNSSLGEDFPTGKDSSIVSTGSTKVIPTGSTILVLLMIWMHMTSDCDRTQTTKVALTVVNLSSLWFLENAPLAEVHNYDNVNNNMINQVVQAMQSSEQSNVVNHSETEITSDSNIIPYSQYVIESQQAAIQNSNSSTQQDALILFNSMNSPEPTHSSRPTKVEVPKELPKVSMVNTSLKKLKYHLVGFDVVVKERTTPTAITEGSWGFEHTKACFRDEIIPFAVEQHRLESKTFEVKMNQVLNKNERLLKQVINKDIVNIIMNSSVDIASVNMHESLKDDLRKLKGKALVDNNVTKQPSDPEMLKIDVEPITPKLLNKKTAHSAYIKHTQEEAIVLRDLFEHVKSKYPLDKSLESCHCNGCMLSDNHDLCVLDFINNVNARTKSKSVKKNSKRKVWKPTGKVLKSVSANKKEPSQSWGSIVFDVPSSSLDECQFVQIYWECFTISRGLPNVEGLGHNLFSVGKFCDSNLEVAFCQHTCFIRNLEGVDLLTGSRGNNLYTLSLGDMMASSSL